VLAKNSATNYDTEWVDVSGGVWGTITGTLSNQTDLQNALNAKFDDPTGTTSQYLRGDGSLATFPAIPSGTVSSVGLTMPSAFTVANSPVTSSGTLAVTGAGTSAQYIRGDGSLATFPSLTGYVPYTGATGDVNLGTHRITAQNATFSSNGSGDTVTITHSSGSGNGLNITKGGNGEGLYINKTSGSGNAATIIGTLNATTLVKSGGTSSQFLKADGSVDSTTYVGGSGASGQVSYWNGTSSQAGSGNFLWDNTNSRLSVISSGQSLRGFVISDYSNSVGAPFAGFQKSRGTFSVPVNVNASDLVGAFSFSARVGGVFTSDRALFGANMATSTGIGLYFNAGSSDGSYAPSMYIHPTGNVAINPGGSIISGSITDSGQRLQVQGTTLLNGNVTFSSSTGMTWDATNSRLGIGTNAPDKKLHIKGDSTSSDIVFETTSYTTKGYFAHYQGATLQLAINRRIDGVFSNTSAASATINVIALNNAGYINFFATNTNNSTPNEIMRINGTGNVLIQNGGTFTDSGERLQVTGTMKVTGASTFNGNMNLTRTVNATTEILISNTTSGANSSAGFTLTSSAGTAYIAKYSDTTTAFKILTPNTAYLANFTSGNIAILNNATSGDILFAAGGSSTAHMTIKSNGRINMSSLPTSSTGLATGDLWNDAGTIKIV
jgi:hypothetical protein